MGDGRRIMRIRRMLDLIDSNNFIFAGLVVGLRRRRFLGPF
jgi:hypothetical protein